MKRRFLVSHEGKVFACIHAVNAAEAIAMALQKTGEKLAPSECAAIVFELKRADEDLPE
jgi:hypothetical protein